MKNIATFLLSISLLLLSLPALSGPPADAGVKRTEVIGEDDWAITNPISLGTITCPGGELAFDAVGMPYCADSNTGRLHYRDAVFWGCVTARNAVTNEIDPRMTGIAYYEIWGNWDAESTGPVGGTWKVVPSNAIGPEYTCERLGPFPEEQVANASEYWLGTWNGKRSYQEFADMGFWVGEFRLVGKGYGGTLEGLHFKGEEVVPTYTAFPVPYEFLPPDFGLYDVAEGVLTGTITE
jgi:hypothetical protein